jgi:RimJ/RimL family protein N-acetyltransferase
MKIIVETPRLVLREMTLGDVDFMESLLTDREIMRFYAQDFTRSDAEAWVRRQLERYTTDGHGGYLAVERDTLAPVGQVGLARQLVEGNYEPEVGYILHRRFWRRGYATEAARAVRDHAFGVLGKPHVVSMIRPINHPSQGVARKLGMRPVKLTLFANLEHWMFRVEREARPG